ncbi:hypothetical protein K458DRAFT_438396 [Lentithecium fluviatile CBS 122367]|uniref:DUF974 domain protein n=1 Tax=Lentithecium fluviatile CBS 122367 TaxID=1168545 RepID=A0A6G1JPW5_9PLEO|nr:hypothetical protein K458DRAFT_438396 [Lentithecium fluviatile CBS 122367]
MAHQRLPSTGDALKTPHTVSLKVLRLSRPSLAMQYPLPNSSTLGIPPTASLAYPSPNPPENFLLSPVLNLPEAFGSAYVGETFSCTLCANNELLPSDKTRTVSGVRIQGDMQTPSTPSGSPLELSGPEGVESGRNEGREDIGPGESLQRILRFELKEEGNHVLAVTVTYTETVLHGEGRAASGRVKTFRKLYQFVAQQLLSVRTKTGDVEGKDRLGRHLLEAQLENMGESPVSLETVHVNAKPPFQSTSLNWDIHSPDPKILNAPILNPRDVIQVAFLLEEERDTGETANELANVLPSDAKRTLGQLAIQWRTSLGDRGSLSTGWLTSRR